MISQSWAVLQLVHVCTMCVSLWLPVIPARLHAFLGVTVDYVVVTVVVIIIAVVDVVANDDGIIFIRVGWLGIGFHDQTYHSELDILVFSSWICTGLIEDCLSDSCNTRPLISHGTSICSSYFLPQIRQLYIICIYIYTYIFSLSIDKI